MSAQSASTTEYDLLVIGGGVNGAGIARDAAGRGLKVLLVEMADIASATSGWSSKLIHGGLRYLEHYEFRLVREALEEREVLLHAAPHIVRPMRFVLPHDRTMRPVWMIRIGLWMYDHLGKRVSLPGSHAVSFPHVEFSAGLKPEIRSGIVYSDCRVDDARLTLLTAMSARDKGATILTRTRFTGGRRENGAWQADLEDMRSGAKRTITATAVVNAAGPWVSSVLQGVPHKTTGAHVRLVKGSHIVVPKVHSLGHACILQNTDKRVIFVIPFEGKWSLIGTTDVPVDTPEEAVDITGQETDYLIEATNRFLAKPISKADVVWTFAGVRPLYDDGKSDPSSITRDYVLELDDEGGKAPILSLFGGKLTTYRCLAETALQKLSPYLPPMGPLWTKEAHLPGGDIPNFNAFRDEIFDRYKGFPRELLDGVVRRHGSRARTVLGDIHKPEDLGTNFGAGLTQREIDCLIAEEWAQTAEDILWRRTKCGLHMDAAQRAAVEVYVASRKGGGGGLPEHGEDSTESMRPRTS
ncbi:MAG: glycerol-3-phosphate dehydrogenase [Betaproteobacteria bacterium]|nr:glycerol-3-phosphate dehydrogenase [Betaproteobacteria bacterium]